MSDELRKAAQALINECTFWCVPKPIEVREALFALKEALVKPVAAPDDAIDWEGVAADQAMTIAMLKVDYQQLQALVTSQGIALMEQEEWQKDAERYRWLRQAPQSNTQITTDQLWGEELDASIDRDMKKETP